jgi:hypothetical protein
MWQLNSNHNLNSLDFYLFLISLFLGLYFDHWYLLTINDQQDWDHSPPSSQFLWWPKFNPKENKKEKKKNLIKQFKFSKCNDWILIAILTSLNYFKEIPKDGTSKSNSHREWGGPRS